MLQACVTVNGTVVGYNSDCASNHLRFLVLVVFEQPLIFLGECYQVCPGVGCWTFDEMWSLFGSLCKRWLLLTGLQIYFWLYNALSSSQVTNVVVHVHPVVGYHNIVAIVLLAIFWTWLVKETETLQILISLSGILVPLILFWVYLWLLLLLD